MTSSFDHPCPMCGRPVPPESPASLCPACLMAGALQPTGGSVEAPPSIEAVSAAFPQLEVVSLLGAGGMGAVYKARQPGLDRFVALKLLPESLAADPAFAQRFEREGRLLARLHHPNIVTVYDSGRAGPFFFLLMEYVEGVNLRQAMQAAPFPPEKALALVPRICEALQFAHDEGVLHRDIKPENILIDARGRVKLADFGIAKLIGDTAADPPGATRLTSVAGEATLVMGTPRYMAPEQRATPSAVDHRADIYSLGVVFYELLTGHTPEAPFQPPSAVAGTDARVDSIVKQALEIERERRQRTATELRTQVENVTAADPHGDRTPVGSPEDAWEYRTKATIGGLPWVHAIGGSGPVNRTARGVFAFGQRASGIFAFGGRASGFFACGGLATGVIAVGGVAAGFFAFGGLSLGLVFALGGVAAGLVATGGMAMGLLAAGGVAIGGWGLSWVSPHGALGVSVLSQAGQERDVTDREAWVAPPRSFTRWLAAVPPFSGLFILPPILFGFFMQKYLRAKGKALSSEPSMLPASSGLMAAGWVLTVLSWIGLVAGVVVMVLMLQESSATGPVAAQSIAAGIILLVMGALAFWGAALRRVAKPRPVGHRQRPWGIALWRGSFAMLLAALLGTSATWLAHGLHRTNVLREVEEVERLQAEAREIAEASDGYQMTKKQHEAGVATDLALVEAQARLDLAMAARNPLKRAGIERDLARRRYELFQALADAGRGTLFDAMKAKYALEAAEAAYRQAVTEAQR